MLLTEDKTEREDKDSKKALTEDSCSKGLAEHPIGRITAFSFGLQRKYQCPHAKACGHWRCSH